MNLLDRLFNRDCEEGISWNRGTLKLHDEDEWTNVFTFRRVDNQLTIVATDGVDTHEVSLDAEQFARYIAEGQPLTGRTVTGVPIKSEMIGEFFHLTIGSITGMWHVDKPRCIKLWKIAVKPFNI